MLSQDVSVHPKTPRPETERLITAMQRSAESVDVPGAPLTLRLESVDVDGDEVPIGWSFVDPEVPPDPTSRYGRILALRRGDQK